ncbi:glycosyltransferase family 4 protein [Clostridium tyrobutyricum]|uniref:glycosyltransferase family 4 protein n=1 Tax=Clostridium tyrobutyricum TaxID=1519 RepID=UPI0030CFBEA4
MKILYICTWNKYKQKTWSGTTYSLYKSLSLKTHVKDIDIKLNKIDKAFFMITRILNLKFQNKSKIYQKKINKLVQYKNDESVVLQIGDYGICKNMTYVYQDLSIDSLFFYKKVNNKLFRYSGFENYSKKYMKYRRYKQLEFYDNTKGIFTMSKWLADNLVNYTKIPKEKVHWVGGGVNININRIKNKKKNNTRILFVGRDFIRKGGDLVYKAFKVLKEKYLLSAELYIAGPKKWPLNEKDNSVKFLGDISPEELSDYFNICDIFCLPSRFEAYGLVFIEALVYGLPCIGRNEFAMKEFIQNGYNGFLINNDDVDNLALKMFDLLNNENIKANVLKNRKKYIENYSWDKVAERIINVIKKDLNS